jgi:hypothetical protein
MVVTCGLDHTLLGGVDSAEQFHQDVVPEVEYGLMGRIGMLPARLVSYGEQWHGDECLLFAEGVVRQAAVFTEAMELHRRIEVTAGTSALRIFDRVVNVGFDTTSHMLLYHVNIGYPVLDQGARLLIAAPPGVPTGDYPPEDYRVMAGPRPQCREQCYEHTVSAEPDGTAPVALVNDTLGLGVYQLYDRRAMPFHTLWRMMGEGTYAVALEPTTNRDAGRFDATQRGELQWLEPGAERSYRLEVGVLQGAEQISAFEDRVNAIEVSSSPPAG